MGKQKTEEKQINQNVSTPEPKNSLDTPKREEVEKPVTNQAIDKSKSDSNELGDAFASFAKVLSLLIDKFGWPGTLGILGLYYINSWMTTDQKKVFIDTYVLGVGIGNKIQIILVAILAVAGVIGQKYVYERKWGKTNEELIRSRSENEKLQAEIKKLKRESNQQKRELKKK